MDASTHPPTPSQKSLTADTISDKLPSREEYLGTMQRVMDRQLAENPELASNPKFTLSAYASGFDLILACRERLDDDTNARLRVAMSQYLGQTPVPDGSDIFDVVRSECQTLLEGHPDLQTKWDEIYGDRERWQRVYDTVQLGSSIKAGST